MKLSLRYCNECKRKTIQAAVHLGTVWSPIKGISVWYCPQCGKQWQPVTKTEDVLREMF